MEEPLLDITYLQISDVCIASIISTVISVAMFSGMILTPAYVQTVRGIEPFAAGLMMLPGAIVMGLMSPITGKLFDKIGPRILAISGLDYDISHIRVSKITSRFNLAIYYYRFIHFVCLVCRW